jgi:hypothetical protein
VSKVPEDCVFTEKELEPQNQEVVDNQDEGKENEPEILEPPINEQEMSDSEGKSDLDEDLNKDETILDEVNYIK